LGYLPRTSPLNLSYEDVFNTVVQSGTVITSDLAATAGVLNGSRAWQSLLAHRTSQRIYSATERAAWLEAATPGRGVQSLQNNLARLVRAGGRIAAGTESPAIPYGLGLHLELALLAEAGIPPDQVLRIATASNAMALGLERQIGTVEEGKIADFLVVSGNPLLNLAEVMNISAVVKGGIWIDQQQLLGQ
jgi:imidazolonepropionase-like amidohydrolase